MKQSNKDKELNNIVKKVPLKMSRIGGDYELEKLYRYDKSICLRL